MRVNKMIRWLVAAAVMGTTATLIRPASTADAVDTEPRVANTEIFFQTGGLLGVPVGTPVAIPVYAYNYTAAPLAITATGGVPTDAHFVLTNGCTGAVVAVNGNCEMTYTFTPDAPGGYLASAEVSVNGTPYTIHLASYGLAVRGTVTGTVTYGTGGPVPNPRIIFTTLDGEQHHNVGGAADGTYSAEVPPGSYCVSFGTEPWDGTTVSYPGKRHCLDGITPIEVTSGATVANIDAVLHLGSISGTLRDHTGALMPANEIARADVVGGRWNPYARTDAAGAYTIVNVPAGTWCVGFWNTPTTDPATPPCPAGKRLVEVAADQAVTGIDLTEAPPTANTDGPTGAVSGKVTDMASVGLADRDVRLQPVDEEYGWWGYATTEADGTYTTSFVGPGQYCALVEDEQGSPLAGEVYADKTSCDGADLITVADTIVTGIDFALATGGTITGQITDPLGAPIANANVSAAKIEGFSSIGDDTDAAGNYTISGLSAGQYCVRATGGFFDTYPPRVYGGGPSCANGATPVSVSTGATTSGIDIQLLTGGSIEGTITFPPGIVPGYGDGQMQIYARDSDGEFFGYFDPELDGRYAVTGLAPGGYCLSLVPRAPSPLVRQLIGSTDPDYCEGGAIEVTDGAATIVDATLAIGGKISGWVIDPLGYPDPDPSPQLDPESGENDRVRPNGSYSISGIEPGSYCVTMPGFGSFVLDQTYDGALDCDSGATLVNVAAGEVTDQINFFKQTGGSISGTITRPAGPGEFTVEFHRLDAAQAVLSAEAGPTGATTSEYGAEVPPGAYCVLVRPHSSTGLANRAYGGTHSCAGATPVVVPDITAVTDIDITLTPQIFYALDNPARLVDTRPGRPVTEGAPEGTGPVAAGTVLEVQVGGLAGVPADAASVALNVTVAGAEGPGHLTLFPCGEPVPTASNVNYVTGQTVPNAAITKLGTDGKVCVFTFATTDIVVDVAGYFPSAEGLIPLTNPARLIDTRPGRPVVDGAPAGTGPIAAQAVLEVQVGGLAGVPADAASAVLNVTAVAAQANGHLTVFACGEEVPTASNVNYVANQTAPNSVIARLGTDGPNAGKVCIYTFAATDLVVDVAGYLPNADGLVPLDAPARLMDTRVGRPTIDDVAAGEGPIEGQTVRELQVGGRAGLPSSAASVVLNVTAAGALANGHLTVFPCGEPAPTASNVNYLAGQTIPNAVIAKLGTDGPNAGMVCIRAHATTDVIVDVAGFLPAGDGPFIDPSMQS